MMMDDHSPSHISYTVPRNQGREAMAYLTYIINFYDSFPDITVFAHGHLTSWHQPETIISKIESIDPTSLQQEGYFSLRCESLPLYWPDPGLLKTWKDLGAYWRMLFPHGDHLSGIKALPNTIRFAAGARFAVTRDQVHKRPLEEWRSIRIPLERDLGDLEELKASHEESQMPSSWKLGLIHEPIWNLLFGKDGTVDTKVCREKWFRNRAPCDYWPTTVWNETKHWKAKCYDQWMENGVMKVAEKTQVDQVRERLEKAKQKESGDHAAPKIVAKVRRWVEEQVA